ncbi:AMED_5909 family protein [Actinokineospora sp. HUAS TT18]|uniref:AMED_5909 family protein n=1 Tax=Actinokineospora sp. HUAS TT18 TaxID=3447451 RepID=UPI003F5267CE
MAEANEVLGREMPGPGSSYSVLVTFHRRAERVYREVALVDRHHYHEAIAWAGIEAANAEKAEKGLREAQAREARKQAKADEAAVLGTGSAVEVSR